MYSLYNHIRQKLEEDQDSFEKALEKEPERKKNKEINEKRFEITKLFYRKRANFYEQVKRYLNVFPKEQLLILIFDDFVKSPEKEYVKVLKFLGVDMSFEVDFKVYNRGKPLKGGGYVRSL